MEEMAGVKKIPHPGDPGAGRRNRNLKNQKGIRG